MGHIARMTAALIAAAAATLATAQPYPTKPIKFIVPFPPAGSTDLSARAVAGKLGERIGQPVIIENRPGAGGNIGTDVVAKSAPDGYTLIVGTVGTHGINPSLYSKMPYDHVKDFAPVILLSKTPNVLVVNPSLPVNSVADVIRLAKSKPNELTFASSGSGTSIHLSGELFKTMAGVQMTHIPYKGSGPMLIDLISGQVNMAFDNLSASMQHIKAGKLKALATTGTQRPPNLPDLPTIAEAGLAGYDSTSWNAIFAPAGTPREVVDRLNREIRAILESPETRKFFTEQGAEAGGGTPAELAEFVRAETAKWQKVVKDSGAKVD
ncbi:MAG: tripartite tricarboxylate transporter substrate binding protein [Pseudomonadota bacterium]|nr:tripartite tricarboxylate transporter substrate binding protein [Pseudomonadota bacterium]